LTKYFGIFITNVARNESFVRKATETADSRKLGLKVQIDFDKKTGIFEWSLQIAMALFVSQKNSIFCDKWKQILVLFCFFLVAQIREICVTRIFLSFLFVSISPRVLRHATDTLRKHLLIERKKNGHHNKCNIDAKEVSSETKKNYKNDKVKDVSRLIHFNPMT